MSATNLELAATAADVLALLVSTVGPRALGSATPAAVAGLTELLRECASYSYALGGSGSSNTAQRRNSSHSPGLAGLGGLSTDRRRCSLPSGMDSPMSPIPEAGLTTAGSAAAEQAAGTVWAPEDETAADARADAAIAAAQQLLHGQDGRQQSSVLRHPSLDATAHPQQQRRRRLVSSSGTPLQDHLTSRPLQTRPQSSSTSCLVCSQTCHETCSYCYLSCAVR
jgi:hypothetical protein